MKTVKEYANSVGKSHQSVYKQLNSKKNKERLENHVWKQDGTTYLDDVAIDILNESRQLIQIQNDIQAHEDNDNLRKEVNDLKNKIINLQDELHKVDCNWFFIVLGIQIFYLFGGLMNASNQNQ